ncbi:MAG: HlyD family secretion protein [Rhodothermales bacterium]
MEQTTTEPTDVRPGKVQHNGSARRASGSGTLRRMVLIAVVGVGAILGVTWGVRAWIYSRNYVSTDDAQVDGRIVPVLAKVGGYVASIHVDENTKVTAGQSLVDLDDAELRDRLATAEAELAAAQETASTGSRVQKLSAQRQKDALQAQLTAARATADRTERDLVRQKALAEEQIVSEQKLDEVATDLETARARVRVLEQQVAAAAAGVSQAESSMRLADARLETAQAADRLAEQQLAYAHIAAPASGTIARRQIETGQLLQPGQPIMAIVADTSVWITANFKETDLDRLRIDQPVDIEVDAYPDCTAHGRVESLSPATGARFALLPPDNATGNFTKVVQRVPVRIGISEGCGEELPLKPGLSTTVHVKTGK